MGMENEAIGKGMGGGVEVGGGGGGIPKGSGNAYGFSFFNALAFQVMMGPPVILFAKSLGAGSVVLGLIAAFTPLMTILQLPAAKYLPRYGYRRFVLMGWGTRTVFIFLVALVPLMTGLADGVRLGFLLGFLFCFNFLRGIASTAWMPWISGLIAPTHRGRFLGRDQVFLHAGCLGSLLVSAWVLGEESEAWEYVVVFLISGVCQLVSLWFIVRIPDVRLEGVTARSAEPVPWRAMLGYKPFRELLVFNLAYLAATGGMGVFSVEFLREVDGFGADRIMLLSAVGYVSPMMVLPVVGWLVDRVGSRPVMLAGGVAASLYAGGWLGLATGWLPQSLWLIGGMNFLAGAFGASFNVANGRAAMLVVPEMGRNHFFALYTVLTSLSMGGAPVVWGAVLDAAGGWMAGVGMEMPRHVLFFGGASLCTLGALGLLPRMVERGVGGGGERAGRG